jgi:uncharacterized protein (TIGR02646 family)
VKFIRKGRKPAVLAKFERKNATTPQVVTYGGLAGPDRAELTKRLLHEQGRLCAYTMRRIGAVDAAGAADFHVEHIRPQSLHPRLQLDYRNIILCAPGRSHCEWGARCKDNADVEESNFLSPLRRDCETRLSFRVDGAVRAESETDEAAKSTISLLNLNHRELIAERSAALRSFGLFDDSTQALAGKSMKPLGGKAAERLSQRICEPNSDGEFEPFCVAIRQVAERFARRAIQRSARLAARQPR